MIDNPKLIRTIILLGVIAVLLIILYIVLSAVLGQNQTGQQTGTIPIPQSEEQLPLVPLTINVRDGFDQVQLDQELVVTFNKSFSQEDVEVTVEPSFPYDTSVEGKQLIITPQRPLQPDTDYTLTVRPTVSQERSFTFKTINPQDETDADTYPIGAREQSEEFQRINYPDVFLANQTPYETEQFVITHEYDPGVGAFVFQVQLRGNIQESRQAFADWLVSLGMTGEQVDRVQIEFR